MPALAQNVLVLSVQEEMGAGDALFASFQKSKGFAATPQTLRLEQYLRQVGDKVAAHAGYKLPHKFHLDPHPAFRSACSLSGGTLLLGWSAGGDRP